MCSIVNNNIFADEKPHLPNWSLKACVDVLGSQF